MLVGDFLRDIDKYIEKDVDFNLCIYQYDEKMKGLRILDETPFYNRQNNRMKEWEYNKVRYPKVKKAFEASISTLACSTGRCDWVDGARCFDIIVPEDGRFPEDTFENIVQQFVDNYKSNPYFQNYKEIMEEYQKDNIESDLERR